MPAVSASDAGTDLGAWIMSTLVRYPLVTPSALVKKITGISVWKNFGPCMQAAKTG